VSEAAAAEHLGCLEGARALPAKPLGWATAEEWPEGDYPLQMASGELQLSGQPVGSRHGIQRLAGEEVRDWVARLELEEEAWYDRPAFLGDPDKQMWRDYGGFWVVTGTDADGNETMCCIEKRIGDRSPAGVQGARQCSHDGDDGTEEVD